jgi:hypothetical protein
MKRQMVKGLTMLALLLTLALATTAVTARGQSQHRVNANVPFDFVVGDKVLPAGDYVVSAIAADTLAIQGSTDGAIRLANPTGRRTDKIALVFHRYGSTYFLSEIWEGRDNTSRQLLKSRQERVLERETARIARHGTRNYEEIVMVASLP